MEGYKSGKVMKNDVLCSYSEIKVLPNGKLNYNYELLLCMLSYFDYEMVTFSVRFPKNLLLAIFTKTYSNTHPPPPPPNKEVHFAWPYNMLFQFRIHPFLIGKYFFQKIMFFSCEQYFTKKSQNFAGFCTILLEINQ